MNSYVQAPNLSLFQSDLLAAALAINNIKTYCDHAFNELYKVIKMDSAGLNLCVIKDNMMLSELESYLFKQPEKIVANYEKTSHMDIFTPLVIGIPRAVFHARALTTEAGYYENDFFKMHCRYFDIYNSIAASARFPGHNHRYIVLYLYSCEEKRMFTYEDIQFLDGILPVFFSTLLYKLDYICEERLIEQVSLINTFSTSPELMKLINKIITNPSGTRKEYAKELGKSPSTLNAQFHIIFEKLGISGDDTKQDLWNKKFQIFENFYFLRY